MDILIKDASVILDAKNSEITKGNIVIENNRITSIGNDTIPDPEYVIESKRLVVLPPPINSHSHVPMTLLRGYSDDKMLYDWLNDIWAVEGYFDAKTIGLGTELACLEMIKSGTGGVVDFYFHESTVGKEIKKAGLRGWLGCSLLSDEFVNQGGITGLIQEAKKTISLYKNEELLKCLIAPHGTTTVSKDDLMTSLELAQENNLPLTIHVSETRDDVLKSESTYGVPPVEWLNKIGFLTEETPVILAHCTWITQREIQIISETKATVAWCPVSGQKLAYGSVCPVPELNKAGATVTLGTDGPASNNTLDMFREMRQGLNLVSQDRWDPSIYTAQEVIHDSCFSFREKFVPETMIKVGAIADLCIMDFHKPHLTPQWNILSNIAYASNGSDVDSLIVNGQLLMKNRKIITLNEEDILLRVKEKIDELGTKVKRE